ncbi:hypothetical protein CI109_103246 [Kwoniella shandongensis]|uniref:Uncharacterized protein n=1 Tax=Kwoniella shandongensis TaxID=1734106 RepID=A0A5M6BTU9_9TREE|nr:uncharacterized protein CI109_006082 [Kwoniella shandongensis]KAA5525631.1 hypothetical protein CI109_006082 [Kwoniella shandongensis]
MVAMTKKAQFDPAAHLSKHGWQGKGTALKQGHATRPLAVVQKKTLSGIGKDRDEAVPFWDHIFAATAATLFSPSPSSSPAPTSQPGPSGWATLPPASVTTNGVPTRPVPAKLSINAMARSGRELARRGLYSRFLRGKVLIHEEEEEEAEVVVSQDVLEEDLIGGSASASVTGGEDEKRKEKKAKKEKKEKKSEKSEKSKSKGKGRAKVGEENDIVSPIESKEERKVRREEKARRKAETEAESASVFVEGETKKGKKRKAEGDVEDVEKKEKKEKRKRKDDSGEGNEKVEKKSKKSRTKE